MLKTSKLTSRLLLLLTANTISETTYCDSRGRIFIVFYFVLSTDSEFRRHGMALVI